MLLPQPYESNASSDCSTEHAIISGIAIGTPGHYMLRGFDRALILGAGKITARRPESQERDTGIDLVNDGEFGHSTGMKA